VVVGVVVVGTDCGWLGIGPFAVAVDVAVVVVDGADEVRVGAGAARVTGGTAAGGAVAATTAAVDVVVPPAGVAGADRWRTLLARWRCRAACLRL
jgi:hypothetical protein